MCARRRCRFTRSLPWRAGPSRGRSARHRQPDGRSAASPAAEAPRAVPAPRPPPPPEQHETKASAAAAAGSPGRGGGRAPAQRGAVRRGRWGGRCAVAPGGGVSRGGGGGSASSLGIARGAAWRGAPGAGSGAGGLCAAPGRGGGRAGPWGAAAAAAGAGRQDTAAKPDPRGAARSWAAGPCRLPDPIIGLGAGGGTRRWRPGVRRGDPLSAPSLAAGGSAKGTGAPHPGLEEEETAAAVRGAGGRRGAPRCGVCPRLLVPGGRQRPAPPVGSPRAASV